MNLIYSLNCFFNSDNFLVLNLDIERVKQINKVLSLTGFSYDSYKIGKFRYIYTDNISKSFDTADMNYFQSYEMANMNYLQIKQDRRITNEDYQKLNLKVMPGFHVRWNYSYQVKPNVLPEKIDRIKSQAFNR